MYITGYRTRTENKLIFGTLPQIAIMTPTYREKSSDHGSLKRVAQGTVINGIPILLLKLKVKITMLFISLESA